MKLSKEIQVRILQLIEEIAASRNAIPRAFSSDTKTRTLQFTEAIARKFGILPQLPGDEEEEDLATVTKEIGTDSRDYSTITAWEGDLDNSGIYSSGDDAIGECYNDSAFDEAFTIDGGGTVGLNSIKLTVASGERHDGTAGTGARIVRTGDGMITIDRDDVSIEWLEGDANDNGGDGNDALLSCPLGADNITLSQLLWHGGLKAGLDYGIWFRANIVDANNSIIYDCENTGTGSADITGLFDQTGSGRQGRFQNLTIHDIRRSAGSGNAVCLTTRDAGNHSVQNVLATDPDASGSTGSGSCFSVSSPSNDTYDHNASSDATASGTGSLTNITTSDQYVSTTGGSEDLHLKSGADAIDAGTDLGTTPSGVEIDIDGRDRDANNDTWDIGADEFVSAATAAFPFILLYGLAGQGSL